MDSTSSAAGFATQSLLALLADGGSRTAALSLLHQRVIQITGGQASLLFEPHPANGQMHATSGAGLDCLPTEAWRPRGDEALLLNDLFAGRRARAMSDLRAELPGLHERLGSDNAVLVPLVHAAARAGLLVVATDGAGQAADALQASDVPAGFLLALELSRLRQREAFEEDIRALLDGFAASLASTLDLGSALEPLCVTATRLFAADRTTVWLYDRESRTLSPSASSDPALLERTPAVRADDPMAPAAAALRTNRAGLSTAATESTSLVAVPLRGCRRALGALIFEGVRIEPGDDISLLQRADQLGRQLSSAVETMQLLGAISRSRLELEQLFASIAHLIVVVDTQGAIVRVNQAFADAVGRDGASLARQPLASCVGRALAEWMQSLPASLPAPALAELRDEVLGGPHVVTATDLASDSGATSGRVIVIRDLVPVLALREREEMRSRLLQSEKLAALGHFVAGIAHELNNPLQSVLGHLELLRDTGAFPERIRQEISRVYRDADRAAKVVRTLMVFAGSGRLERRRVGLNGILQKVLALRKASCRSHQIEVVRHYDQQLPRIEVDPLLLHQVFLNIVMNAEQAVASSGRTGRIDIRTGRGRGAGWVFASVHDSGAGIGDDTLPRVFEPFYTTRDVGQGVGLGLSLAYGIVQEHGGRISAGNHPDGGAVFTVELPIALPA